MKKVSVLGIVGSVISLVTGVVMTILAAQEAAVVMENYNMIMNLIVMIIAIVLLVVFSTKRNSKINVSGLSIASIIITIVNVYLITQQMYKLDNPYIGSFPFGVCALIIVIGNVLSLSSLLENKQ